MTDATPVVYVVDDDPSVLRSLTRLLTSEGFEARGFATARGFLLEHDATKPGCAVLDLSLPDLDGLQLQQELAACGRPIIFLSGHGDVSSSVKAMKAGAIDFLTKPVLRAELLQAIGRAIARDGEMRAAKVEHERLDQRLGRLTPRERQVFELVAAGRLNKQVAAKLGTAEKTVKVHRARVMEKLGVRSVVDLARIADRARGELAADTPDPRGAGTQLQ